MFEKVRLALKRNMVLDDHTRWVAQTYGDESGFHVEEPLPYSIFPPGTDYLSYGKWVEFSSRIANLMRDRLGIRKGDRVAIVPGNGIEVVTIITAAMRLGAIAVPMNYMLRGREIRHCVEDSGAKVLFTDVEVFANNIGDRSVLPTIEKWVMVGADEEAPEGFEPLGRLLEGTSPEFRAPRISPDDVIGIFYTSGTTGFPKGAMVTSRGLLEAQCKAAAILPLSKKDFGVLSLPLAHIFGFAISVMGASAGCGGIIMRHFDPELPGHHVRRGPRHVRFPARLAPGALRPHLA